MNQPNNYHYASDIKLTQNSLVEAWLEIQWKLEEDQRLGVSRDKGFEIALGILSRNVRDVFPTRVTMDASIIPSELLPYVVRYQFRTSENGWPLLQIGPGVATVNFTNPYHWDLFKEKAIYLRQNLLEAYEQNIETKSTILRYRNAIPFNYKSEDVRLFLKQNLNIDILYPQLIPGHAGTRAAPLDFKMEIAFTLKAPIGRGIVKIATGHRVGQEQIEAVVFELEVNSTEENAPNLNNEERFTEWLDLSHSSIHEWFFALIEGPLRKQFQEG